MTDLQLTVRLNADNSGLVGEVRVSKEEIDRFGREVEQSGRQATTASAGVARYGREVDRAGRETGDLTERNRRLAQSYGQVRAAIAAVGLGLLARQFVQTADTATLMRSRLRLVAEGEEDLRQVEEALFRAAQDTRSSYEGTVELYARVARAAGALGVTQEQLLQVTTTVNQAIQVSGAAPAEAAAGVLQLSQGLASGLLRGEELNSVLEQTPRLARAIADGLGVSIGELRRMGAEGELTAERVFGALLDQAEEIGAEFEQLERTVGQALQQLRNDLLLAVSGADDMAGATDVLVEAIDDVREIVRDPEFREGLAAIATFMAEGIGFAVRNAEAIALLTGAYGTVKVATMAWTAAQVALNIALRANPIGIAITGVGLLAAGLYALVGGGQESAQAIAEYDEAMRGAIKPMGDFTEMSEEAATAAAEEAKRHLENAKAINIEMQARLLALRTLAAFEQLPSGVGATVVGLAERGLSPEQILTGPDSPFGPDVPYTNQTETVVARIVALTQELRVKGQDLRDVQGSLNELLASGFLSGGGSGGGDGEDTTPTEPDPEVAKRLAALRQARENMEFELSLLGRTAREQVVLNALRGAGAEATLAAWQSLDTYVAGLSEEEQAVAASAAALWDRQRVMELATEAEERHADAVEDIRDRLLDLMPAHQRAVAEANAWRAATLAALDETAEGYDAYVTQVERIHGELLAEAYEEDLRNRRDWAAGVERALRDVADEANDQATQFEDLTRGSLDRAEDAWVSFVKNRKLDLDDLGSFIEDWFLRYSFNQFVGPQLEGAANWLGSGGADAIGSIIGSIIGGSSGSSGRAHIGGRIGDRALPQGPGVPAAVFSGAPRYHRGGPVLAPGEVPIVAQAGEWVMTPEQYGNMGGLVASLAAIAGRGSGGGEMTLRIVDAQGNEVPAQRRQTGSGTEIEVSIDALVGRLMRRSGSETNRALRDFGGALPLRGR